MAKVRVVGLRGELDRVLDQLYGMGRVELVPAHEEPAFGLSPVPEEPELTDRAQRLRSMADQLDGLLRLADEELGMIVKLDALDPAPKVEAAALREELETKLPEIQAAARRLDGLRNETRNLNRYAGTLERVLPLVPELAELDGPDLAELGVDTAVLVLETPDDEIVRLLRLELSDRLGRQYELAWERVDADTAVCLLVYPHDKASVARELLTEERVRHLAVPEAYEQLSLREAITAIRRRLTELPEALASARVSLQDLLSPRLADWTHARVALRGQAARIEARSSAGVTERAFVLLGWVPCDELEGVSESLVEGSAGRLAVSAGWEADGSEAPVLLRNSRPARPFEMIVRLFDLPRGDSFDPSVLLAVFLPLMFGVMVGDVVYGAVLLGLALWLRARYAQRSAVLGDMSRVMALGAAWAIVFGFLFGEALGNFARRYLGMDALWFYRGSPDAIEPLFTFVLALGVAHVVLGLALGIWQARRMGDRHQLLERAGTLAAVCGVSLLGATALATLPAGFTFLGLGLVGGGLIAMVALQGAIGPIVGPVELAGAVGNVLSYLRLGAVGLASVYLAIVANEFAVAAPLAIGLVAAIFLHTLNLALAGFSPMVQSLRLHYVEFFSKFYAGGGRAFRPFGAAAALAHPAPNTSV